MILSISEGALGTSSRFSQPNTLFETRFVSFNINDSSAPLSSTTLVVVQNAKIVGY